MKSTEIIEAFLMKLNKGICQYVHRTAICNYNGADYPTSESEMKKEIRRKITRSTSDIKYFRL